MDIQVLSFGLAIVLGLVCFGLVKHTADEFDSWYENPGKRHLVRLRVPAAAGLIATLAIAALFVLAR